MGSGVMGTDIETQWRWADIETPGAILALAWKGTARILARSEGTMRTEEILQGLITGRAPIGESNALAKPGVYAMFLSDGSSLPVSHNPAEPLYTGTSSNLAQREFDTHFAAGQSGFSTVRRSLGALLLDDLERQPRPRGTGAS
jgi:GIY-YIG catalytic domain